MHDVQDKNPANITMTKVTMYVIAEKLQYYIPFGSEPEILMKISLHGSLQCDLYLHYLQKLPKLCLIAKRLTLSQTSPGFYVSAVQAS